MNNICLTGRLTSDVELKQTSSNIAVCSFTIAVKRPNVKDATDFINCTAWRNTAEFVSRYFKKGQMIAVSGYLTSNKFEDKDGNKRTSYEVVCDRCEFCESKKASESKDEFQDVSGDGDLPF